MICKADIYLAVKKALPAAANDSRPVFERLLEYAKRGMDAPESLSVAEIKQLSFALSLLVGMIGEKLGQ